jgi:hypothetical protein
MKGVTMAAKQKKLGPATRTILDALGERVIPSGGVEYPGAGDIGLSEIMIERLGQYPGGLLVLTAVLWWWELSPFTWSLSFKRFTKMTISQQIHYMEGWEKSRFLLRRLIFLGLKALYMVIFYNQPRVQEKIGYVEECLVQEQGGAE